MNFLIAPDFPPEHFAGWHLLNTTLQRRASENIHLITPSSAASQNEKIEQDIVDIIYANPFDAAGLVRERGYIPIARPKNISDEMVIVTGLEHPTIKVMADIKPGARVALTNNHDVKLIGLRLLEAVDITEGDLEWNVVPSFQAAARMAIRGEVDLAFFVASSYHSLSSLTHNHLQKLIESHLADVVHVVLVHPRRAEFAKELQEILVNMKNSEAGMRILQELDMKDGFEALTRDQTEFMIDLMDTLLD